MILDCATCGGPMPADRRCCPHCHCKSSAWKRWAIVASTAVGLAGCDSRGLSTPGKHDMSTIDLSQPEGVIEYGPAMTLDFSETPDGGVDGG